MCEQSANSRTASGGSLSSDSYASSSSSYASSYTTGSPRLDPGSHFGKQASRGRGGGGIHPARYGAHVSASGRGAGAGYPGGTGRGLSGRGRYSRDRYGSSRINSYDSDPGATAQLGSGTRFAASQQQPAGESEGECWQNAQQILMQRLAPIRRN